MALVIGGTTQKFGKVNQLIQNVVTSGSVTHTTTSWVATPHLVVITPSATSSNIYLTFSFII